MILSVVAYFFNIPTAFIEMRFVGDECTYGIISTVAILEIKYVFQNCLQTIP